MLQRITDPQPLFSVVIPVKDEENLIIRSLSSVINQGYPAHEIIVVDGHSIDNTTNVVNSLGIKNLKLITQSGTGVSKARNQGITAATGTHIAFLDADDEWLPSHLDTLVHLIRDHPHAGIFSDLNIITLPDGSVKEGRFYGIPECGGILPNFFACCANADVPVHTSTIAIPKDILIESGGFPEWASFNEDHATWMKIALQYPVAFSWKLGAKYCIEWHDVIFERYQFSREIASVTVLREEMSAGRVPDEMKDDVIAYIERMKLYTLYRNLSLVYRTLHHNPPALKGIKNPQDMARYLFFNFIIVLKPLFAGGEK